MILIHVTLFNGVKIAVDKNWIGVPIRLVSSMHEYGYETVRNCRAF